MIALLLIAGLAQAYTLSELEMVRMFPMSGTVYESRDCGTVWCCSTCGEPVEEIGAVMREECGATEWVDNYVTTNRAVCTGWYVAPWATRTATGEEIKNAKASAEAMWTPVPRAIKRGERWIVEGRILQFTTVHQTRLAICKHGHISGRADAPKGDHDGR